MDGLLAADEFPTVDVREGQGPFVIVCEHASNRLPRSLGTLGLGQSDLDRHIAWDPGAVEVAAGMARQLDGALVLQRYSRLAIDCNREPDLDDAIAASSEDTPIPGNAALSAEARAARIAEIWQPFHAALADLIARRKQARIPTALVTVHSFTPVYRGVARPWHAGIISTGDRWLTDRMLAALKRDPALVVGDNEPYSAKDNVDYTIRRHGRDCGLPHAMIEVRNDLLKTAGDRDAWAGRLAAVLETIDLAAIAA